MIQKAAKIVCVSKGIENVIRLKFNTNNTQTIYNPIGHLNYPLHSNSNGGGYILFLGRLEDDVKNISLLLDAYNTSMFRNKIKVKIFGDGPDKALLQEKIKRLGISDGVKIYPFTKDVENQIVNSRFLVLTSHFEGFPRALIESLAMGVPVVSVNCNGPEEIIQHEINGLLVENYDQVALARAMERMFNDEELYNKCKKNAIKSVEHLRNDTIGLLWSQLLHSIKQN